MLIACTELQHYILYECKTWSLTLRVHQSLVPGGA